MGVEKYYHSLFSTGSMFESGLFSIKAKKIGTECILERFISNGEKEFLKFVTLNPSIYSKSFKKLLTKSHLNMNMFRGAAT